MKRSAFTAGALVCALLPWSASALAAPSRDGAARDTAAPGGAARGATGSASGTITASGGSWFTIQTAGRRAGVVNAMIATADALTRANYSYVWGGGHAEAGVATVVPGRGRHPRRIVGFDCSGSVSAVLAGAGVWAPGSPVPNDAGVVSQLLAEHVIARGPGRSPTDVTLYDDPGVHIFMNIDGRFFGTSDGGGGGTPNGGPGWLYDGAPDAFSRTYRQYHVLPSVLRDSTTYGHTLTFQTGSAWDLLDGTAIGDRVQVGYAPSESGTMLARTLSYVGAMTASGTVAELAPDGSSFAILTARGRSMTFTTRVSGLTQSVSVGDKVAVTYTRAAGVLTARALSVTAGAITNEASGTITATSAGGSSFTLQTADGSQLVMSVPAGTDMLGGFHVGDAVTVGYVQVGRELLVEQVTPDAAG